jgi:RNA polymerase sigma factor (sigma-70 family)
VSPPPFQTFLEEHGPDVHRFLVAAVGRSDADDCFQETFVAAMRAYPRLRRGSNLRAWVLRIAQRKAIDAHRARGRRAVPVAAVPEAPGFEEEPSVTTTEPAVWGAVRALPEKQRAAVFHRCVMGMSYPELAEVLDCSQDAARRSVHEGLKRLREEYRDD